MDKSMNSVHNRLKGLASRIDNISVSSSDTKLVSSDSSDDDTVNDLTTESFVSTDTDDDTVNDLTTESFVSTDTQKQKKQKTNRLEKIKCLVCGREFKRRNKAQHERTKFHKSHVELNQQFLSLLRPSASTSHFRWQIANGNKKVFQEESSEESDTNSDSSDLE